MLTTEEGLEAMIIVHSHILLYSRRRTSAAATIIRGNTVLRPIAFALALASNMLSSNPSLLETDSDIAGLSI